MKKAVLFLAVLVVISLGFLFCGGGGTTASDRGSGIYTISGTVIYEGNGLEGVTMQLTGEASQTASTDVSGNYSFSNLPAGTYAVTPSFAGYTFTQTKALVTIYDENVTVSFTASD